jgi:hypothetical protein
MYLRICTLAKQSGSGTDQSRSGTKNRPISSSSWSSKKTMGFTANCALAASISRSTTSSVGDFRRNSYSETDDCCVRAIAARRRCDIPAARRATSITVFGAIHPISLIID